MLNAHMGALDLRMLSVFAIGIQLGFMVERGWPCVTCLWLAVIC